MDTRILDTVTNAYLEACAFTDFGPDGDIPSDAEFAPETIQKARSDCQAFIEQAGEMALDYSGLRTWDAFGHDIWFTRNRHGVGFWDRGLGELGDKLTTLAQSKAFGEVWSYLGDDGLVYIA